MLDICSCLSTSKHYRIYEIAQSIGRATSTIRRWEREGKLTAKRLPSGQRYYDESDVRLMLGGESRVNEVRINPMSNFALVFRSSAP